MSNLNIRTISAKGRVERIEATSFYQIKNNGGNNATLSVWMGACNSEAVANASEDDIRWVNIVDFKVPVRRLCDGTETKNYERFNKVLTKMVKANQSQHRGQKQQVDMLAIRNNCEHLIFAEYPSLRELLRYRRPAAYSTDENGCWVCDHHIIEHPASAAGETAVISTGHKPLRSKGLSLGEVEIRDLVGYYDSLSEGKSKEEVEALLMEFISKAVQA